MKKRAKNSSDQSKQPTKWIESIRCNFFVQLFSQKNNVQHYLHWVHIHVNENSSSRLNDLLQIKKANARIIFNTCIFYIFSAAQFHPCMKAMMRSFFPWRQRGWREFVTVQGGKQNWPRLLLLIRLLQALLSEKVIYSRNG